MNSKKILAIIPARGGSKGVYRKNIRLLNHKPLIAYTIEEALKGKYIDRVVVSTDDMEIANISKVYGADVPFLRPQELAKDMTPSIDAVMHCIEWLDYNENYNPDYICLLQCTSPLRTYEDIDGAIKKVLENNFEGAVSVCEAEVNPYWTNVFKGEKLEYFLQEGKKFTRRQDLPKIYRINGSIYIARTDLVLKNKSIEVENTTGYVMNAKKSIDIDTEMDFKFAELLIKECK